MAAETLCMSFPSEIARDIRAVAAAEERPVSRVIERAFRLYLATQRFATTDETA